MAEYWIEIIDGGRTTMGVEGDFHDLPGALNWEHYYLGFYRCESVRLYEGEHRNPPGAPTAEIFRPVIRVDEAGLLGSQDMAALFETVGRVNAWVGRAERRRDQRRKNPLVQGPPLTINDVKEQFERATAEERQEAVDAAAVALVMDSLKQYGLIEGRSEVNFDRCLDVLELGKQ